jgi:hypothetical protein
MVAWLRGIVRLRCLRRFRASRPVSVAVPLGARHLELARRAQDELVLAKRAYRCLEALELMAARAFGAAKQKSGEYRPEVPASESLRLARARTLQLFMTQPFQVAHSMTGWDGCHVELEATLDGCQAIPDGAVDALPPEAFAYAGTLEDARQHAAQGTARSF